ncbi:hypothetical protein [Leifsonia shinshuensis]|uniref:hypothetical protein n=1 Tax=Leifsonia shinshuensis TaxID=150026 RepID=UPI0028658661|nr:hypothetical protein [Leifsonia shinshuensis]MDR6971030.1 hypothetical protein [Leifsonia shinshuensis]
MPDDDIDYEALIAELTDPDKPLTPTGKALYGEEAARAGREMLLREYGSEEALEPALKPGRPGLGSAGDGPSPTVRARVSRHDFDELAKLKARTGRTEADLLREGVHLLLERYKTAS